MISERSWKRGKSTIYKKFIAEMIGSFTKLYVRNEIYAKRFVSLGVKEKDIVTVGGAKIDVLLEMIQQPPKEDWSKLLKTNKGPIFIAGSTHSKEDEVVVCAYRKLKEYDASVRLIIASRYIDQSDKICENIKDEFKVYKYSKFSDNWENLVVDKKGILFDLYGIGKVAFVGGSFTKNGGHSILEPAVWSIPIQDESLIYNLTLVSDEFINNCIANQVQSSDELTEIWLKILNNEIDADDVRLKRDKYFTEKSGSTQRTWNEKKRLKELKII